MSAAPPKWWKSASIYQIYPASFKDSNDDGIGDLPGILSKLDYVKSIGVDAIWISPFFESPNADQGYDISDYQRPDPTYGKLEDIEAIIKGCHDRGLKILFDLVINHSSDQHRWFKESRKSKDNPYRKYYIWKPPRYDKDGNRLPPTNWKGIFGGSAWEWDETTQEYYLHLFVVGQPDFNFEDAEVREAIFKESISFWLERGIDGMRIDVGSMYSKHAFEDVEIVNPKQYVQPAMHKYIDGPRLKEYLKEMVSKTFSKYDSVTIAEVPGERSLEEMLAFVSEKEEIFSMCITFDLQGLDHHGQGLYKTIRKWKLSEFKAITEKEQRLSAAIHGGWVCNYLENHDQARSVSRFMSDSPEHRVISAKSLAMYLLTLSGTPIIYQGEEIGMINFPGDWSLEEYDDPASQLHMEDVRQLATEGNGMTEQIGMDGLRLLARDHARTPMQWSSDKQAGFSGSDKTWMRVMDSYKDINVAKQDDDPDSVLAFYRHILDFRQNHKAAMVFGEFVLEDKENEKVMTYLKQSDEETLRVILNFSSVEQDAPLVEEKDQLLLSSAGKSAGGGSKLRPYEGRIYKI